jgi:hypothetical protein
MYSELDLFLTLALSATFHKSDTAVIQTLERLIEGGKIDPSNGLIKTIRNAQSPLTIVMLALQHYEPEGYKEA